jgi:hypothetical protein
VLNHVITSSIAHADGSEETKTIGDFIIAHNCIHGIEQTNRIAGLGKVFLKPDTANILQAQLVVDLSLKELYQSGTTPPFSRILTHHAAVMHPGSRQAFNCTTMYLPI